MFVLKTCFYKNVVASAVQDTTKTYWVDYFFNSDFFFLMRH